MFEDLNKWTLEQSIDYLIFIYEFQSSVEAKCIMDLIRAYKKKLDEN